MLELIGPNPQFVLQKWTFATAPGCNGASGFSKLRSVVLEVDFAPIQLSMDSFNSLVFAGLGVSSGPECRTTEYEARTMLQTQSHSLTAVLEPTRTNSQEHSIS